MKTQAAVLVETGRPLVLADLEVPAPGPGQVLVEISHSGICHTQILECRGRRGEDRYLPHCLGHEGSGIVREVGPQVAKVKAGDRVVLSWIKGSGADVPGAIYRWNGRLVHAGGVTTFQRLAVVSENRLTPLPEGISPRDAVLLGCAVPTGMGAVFNTLGLRAGQSTVIFGLGGVGLCALAAAAQAGGRPLLAVDVRPEKLDLAKALGATHAILGGRPETVSEILQICPGGADAAVEASGHPDAMRQALECVRPRGGAAVIIGNAPHGQRLTLDPREFNLGKRLLGTWGGDTQPDRDFPRYIRYLAEGRLPVASLISRVYRLEEVNSALDDLEAGRAVRPVLDMSL